MRRKFFGLDFKEGKVEDKSLDRHFGNELFIEANYFLFGSVSSIDKGGFFYWIDKPCQLASIFDP